MKALILVGGEGTRLRPLTSKRPKSVVPILNRPFLEQLLLYLKKHGIIEVVLAVGYLPTPIQNCIGDGSGLGMTVHYSLEDSPLGTAGAVKNAEVYLDDTFLVFNGDIVTEIDLSEMIKRHMEVKPRVSIALTPVDNPTLYGVVETDSDRMVKRFVEKPSWDAVTTNMINAGIYILEPDVLKLIPPGTKYMFEHHVFPSLLHSNETMLSYPSSAYWIDIGTPEKYLKVHHDLLSNHSNSLPADYSRSQVHPSARVAGPALLGEGCSVEGNVKIKGPAVLGAGCQVRENAVIDGCVLWDRVQVGEGSVLKQCIIGSGTVIEAGCYIPDGCILGENVLVKKGLTLASGTRADPDACLK